MIPQKRIFRYLVVCIVLFIIVHVFYTGGPTFRYPKLYTVYYKDDVNKFVVLRVDDRLKLTAETYNDMTSKQEVLPSDYGGYFIEYIDGYDYTNYTNFRTTQALRETKVSSLVVIDYEKRFVTNFVDFFDNLLKTLDACKPDILGINNDEHYSISKQENKYANRDGRINLYGGHLRENYLDEQIRTKEYLASFIRLDENEKAVLQASHNKFLNEMPQSLPDELLKFTKFNSFMKGDGIVLLGGDDYNQLALTSIKMLRSAGSKLPIELIIPRERDYDIDLCNNLLPSLGGQCKIMAHYLPSSAVDKIKGYQLKNVALLISSFERVLYLDADNIPVSNPDTLFNNEPLKSHDLVLWPDLWRRLTSPLFYEIAEIAINDNVRLRNSYFNGDQRGDSTQISYHDAEGAIPEASSETGQLLINKKVHFKTLILSMYYNYYGPDFYYPLLSQGAAGEGDKETFIAAAHKLQLSYYQVQEFNREFGPIKAGSRHDMFAMGQYDPIIDYIQQHNHQQSLTLDFVPDYAVNVDDHDHLNYNFHYFKLSALMFLHANWPKLKLTDIFLHNGYGRGPTIDDQRRRLYEKNIIEETGGIDLELSIFQTLQWLYCDLKIEITKVPHIGTNERTKICSELDSQLLFLVEN